MGPDEYISREELGQVLRYVFAKMQQQAEMLAILAGNILTEAQLERLQELTEKSPRTQAAKDARSNLNNFLEMHNIVQRYQTPPEE